MNLFDFIRDVIAKKKGDLLNDVDNRVVFLPFLVQRWGSFFNHNFTKLLNQTSNRLYPVFDQKQDWYKFFLTVIPKMRFHKIRYIKKNREKQTNEELKDVIQFLARNQQLSTREIREYVEMSGLDLKELKKKL